MRITQSIGLPVPCEAAWAFLVDWEHQASWMKDADRVQVVGSQREGVGTRIRVKTRLFGIPAFVEPMEVRGWDPPHRLLISHGSIVKGTGEWVLESLGSAHEGCRFTWHEDITLRAPVVGELAARCYGVLMGRLMRGSLAGVRAALLG